MHFNIPFRPAKKPTPSHHVTAFVRSGNNSSTPGVGGYAAYLLALSNPDDAEMGGDAGEYVDVRLINNSVANALIHNSHNPPSPSSPASSASAVSSHVESISSGISNTPTSPPQHVEPYI